MEVAALAMGSRELGQALTGAAISGVPLCEGRRLRVVALDQKLRVLGERTDAIPAVTHDISARGTVGCRRSELN